MKRSLNDLELYSSKLINWYKANHRNLPWRETNDPYRIYLSEIILQQTQVKQGLSYYQKFVTNYPTVKDLANATEDEILKDWQGLGYYSRARNMHFAAKQIINEFNGIFPDSFDQIIKLKGVGEYTASAIASFAFNESKAVLDGNVFRVISRLFGLDTPIDTLKGKKEFQNIADELLDKNNPALHNQAIMEFGAMFCRPKNPNCLECPLQANCIAFGSKSVNLLPIKAKRIKQKPTFYYYILFEYQNRILIHHRKETGIWQNLYDFFLIERDKIEENLESLLPHNIGKFELISISKEYVHLLTHKKIFAKFIRIRLEAEIEFNGDFKWERKENLSKYAIPKLIENYLNDESKLLSLEL